MPIELIQAAWTVSAESNSVSTEPVQHRLCGFLVFYGIRRLAGNKTQPPPSLQPAPWLLHPLTPLAEAPAARGSWLARRSHHERPVPCAEGADWGGLWKLAHLDSMQCMPSECSRQAMLWPTGCVDHCPGASIDSIGCKVAGGPHNSKDSRPSQGRV